MVRLEGYVQRVIDGIAYVDYNHPVTGEACEGEISDFGELREHRRFVITIESLPLRELSRERVEEIHRQVHEALGDDEHDYSMGEKTNMDWKEGF